MQFLVSVANEILGRSPRAILEAMIGRQTGPQWAGRGIESSATRQNSAVVLAVEARVGLHGTDHPYLIRDANFRPERQTRPKGRAKSQMSDGFGRRRWELIKVVKHGG